MVGAQHLDRLVGPDRAAEGPLVQLAADARARGGRAALAGVRSFRCCSCDVLHGRAFTARHGSAAASPNSRAKRWRGIDGIGDGGGLQAIAHAVQREGLRRRRELVIQAIIRAAAPSTRISVSQASSLSRPEALQASCTCPCPAPSADAPVCSATPQLMQPRLQEADCSSVIAVQLETEALGVTSVTLCPARASFSASAPPMK